MTDTTPDDDHPVAPAVDKTPYTFRADVLMALFGIARRSASIRSGDTRAREKFARQSQTKVNDVCGSGSIGRDFDLEMATEARRFIDRIMELPA